MLTIIHTERLDLIPLTVEFHERSLADDRAGAAQLLGAVMHEEWWEMLPVMRMWRDALHNDPGLQPWLARAIVLRGEGVMAGHAGFHTRPAPAYLENIAPGGVEMGYTVFTPYRRRGIARETVLGLMGWAQREYGVTRFVLSISPQNSPSLKLAAGLGFVKIGSHIDEEDGPEDIFELRVA